MSDNSAEPTQLSVPAPRAGKSARFTHPPGDFDRAMFAAMIPALVLPPLAVAAAWLGESARGTGAANLIALVVGVFMFVQLGSQVLNSWLILRRPASLRTHALPRELSVVNAITYATLLLWAVALSVSPATELGLVCGGVLAILGIIALLITIGARMDQNVSTKQAEQAHQPHTLWTPAARVGTASYIVMAVIGVIVATIIAVVQESDGSLLPPVAGVSALILVLLGLPWSHTLYGAVFAVVSVGVPELQGTWSVLPILAIPVFANIAIAATLLVSSTHRVSVIRWFFRIRLAEEVGD
ncbi:MAG: hypothetical protein ACOH1J_01310 [Microbacteriaceae bacterium]